MKKIFWWRKEFFLASIIVFLMLMMISCSNDTKNYSETGDDSHRGEQTGIVTALTGLATGIVDCINNDNPPDGPTEVITDGTWETLAAISTYPAFSDFTPTGKTVLYTGHENLMQKFTFPTTGDPQGVFTTLTAPADDIEYYISFAWVSDSLYLVQGKTVYVYSITDDNWTKLVDNTLPYSHTQAQSTADDSGFVYSLVQSEYRLLKYNTNNNTYEYITTPSDLTASEPRAAWDSQTQRVYMADYATSGSGFYAFNPDDNSFTALAPLPVSSGMSDAFGSDRRGHIFTADGDGSSYAFWVYTAATNSWQSITNLPYPHGNNSSCTVSADGWLYFADAGQTNIVRYKVF